MDKLLQNLHIIIIFLLLYFAWLEYQDFEMSETRKKNESVQLNQQLEVSTKKLSEIKVYKRNLARSRKKLKDVRAQIVEVQRKLPSEKNQTELLNFLSDQADRLRLMETSFKPLKEKNKELYFEEQYEVIGVGTFQQFLVYLEKIGSQDRLYNIHSIQLRLPKSTGEGVKGKRSSKFQVLESRIVVETYRFNRDFFRKSVSATEGEKK